MRRTQQRRQLILETAVECFVTKGFHRSSIRDIASEAGISIGNVYNHFQSKEALIAEIAVLEAAELMQYQSVLTGSDHPLAAIERFLDEYLADAQKPSNAILAVEITAEAMRNPLVGKGFIANPAEACESDFGRLVQRCRPRSV